VVEGAATASPGIGSGVGHAAFRSIGELAELCGRYCWVERRIFELTGIRASRPASAPSADSADSADSETGSPHTGDPGAIDPEIRVVLSAMSAGHGFLAAQWRERLPVRAGVDADALIAPPPGPLTEALDLIEAEPHLTLVLGGLATQVLPWLEDGYRRQLAQASPVSEAPVRAVLDWAALSTAREIRTADLLLRRLAPRGEQARSVENFGDLVQRLLRATPDSSPGARAS
jgi:hypothetical protein